MGNIDINKTEIFPVMGKIMVDRFGYSLIDLTRNNPALAGLPVEDQDELEKYMDSLRNRWKADFLWGGYGEQRYFYQASDHFGQRNIHLGVDIWAPAGTPVFAPMDGILHSQAYNGNFRDYGATILLEHTIGDETFISLFGHLSRESLSWRNPGQAVKAGDMIARLGSPAENGGWIPHLHLQLIRGSLEKKGDFTGVCNAEEWPDFHKKCPDPTFLIFPE